MSFGPYCYFNNGLSYRAVASGYVAQSGEVVFADTPSTGDLTSAFAGYTAAATGVVWSGYQAQAQAKLSDSDITMSRTVEAVALGLTTFTTGDVVAFVDYRRALRSIVSASSGDPTQPLPTKPTYPSGT